ncbi:MAG: DUF4956 domain-containing protein [Chlamydiae bacterium]|nr:DUF4956 domain-containing protein [Chlamydiota bacterium]MBI3266852.1 DUF4956 domain-containing protein [Chlamydiota bacterium]
MNKIFKTLAISQQVAHKMDPGSFILALLLSLASSLLASFLYSYFYEHRGTGSQVHRAFPLLGLSITTLFLGIQMSLPLSLGLLGALSIVRFRTPIKEPEEVGFVMLVIASSITCAIFQFQLLEILYLVAILTLFLRRGIRFWKHHGRDGILILSLKDQEAGLYLDKIISYLQTGASRNVLETSSSQEGKTSLQFSFTGLKKDVAQLQKDMRELFEVQTAHVFFSRPGGIR